MYTWDGMRKLSRKEIEEDIIHNGLVGLYLLYPDNTEAAIYNPLTKKEVDILLQNGIEIGQEK